MKTDVFGLTINYKSWDKKQALPLYVAGNYEIDEAIVSNNRFIVMSPIGDLPTLPAMKKHIEKIQKIDDVPVAFYDIKKSFYGCSNYPECKFTLAEHFRKKKLTKTNVKELLEGKETLVKGIKNKEKKPYNAVVKIGEKGYIDFISFSK